MKVSLTTPKGNVTVEIPPEAEVVRIDFTTDDKEGAIDVNVDAAWLEGRNQDVPVAQHLIGTWINYGTPSFGVIEDTEHPENDVDDGA